jgi:hypothetical protein
MHHLTVKQSLDALCKDIAFDKKLYHALQTHNLDFLTKDGEHRNLFGGQLIGCYRVKYTLFDQQQFFSVFKLETRDVEAAIRHMTTINKTFKILTDPINMMCFYVAHRFLSNLELKKEDRIHYAQEVLNFFSYRTLVVICSNYFIYPISEQEATGLFEKLSYKYTIKNVRNWKDYCKYRSTEYLDSKYLKTVTAFTEDDLLANAINDLYIRTKDTIKNIYKEFVELKELQESVTHRKSILIDIDGKEALPDKLDSADKHYDYLLTRLVERDLFIRLDVLEVAVSIVKNADEDTLKAFLEALYTYTHKSKGNFEKVTDIFNRQSVFIVSYLNSNSNILGKSLIETLNKVSGVVLYSRSTDTTLNLLKGDVDALIMEVYLSIHKSIFPTRKITDTRNSFFIYIYLLMFLEHK